MGGRAAAGFCRSYLIRPSSWLIGGMLLGLHPAPASPASPGAAPAPTVPSTHPNHPALDPPDDRAGLFPPEPSGPGTDGDLQRAETAARGLAAAGRWAAARDRLAAAYFGRRWDPAPAERLRNRLNEWGWAALRDHREPGNAVQVVRVQRGETLGRIAGRERVTAALIGRLNRVSNPRRLPVGAPLKVPRGPFDALVRPSLHELIVLRHGHFVRSYPIGVGQGRTPEGLFRVRTKVVHPAWYPPHGGVVAAGDPANPLGSRWIGLGHGWGIHGTNQPDSIGTDRSHGCIRLAEPELREVFDLLVPGSRVLIRP